jgi:hypothetical protein
VHARKNYLMRTEARGAFTAVYLDNDVA